MIPAQPPTSASSSVPLSSPPPLTAISIPSTPAYSPPWQLTGATPSPSSGPSPAGELTPTEVSRSSSIGGGSDPMANLGSSSSAPAPSVLGLSSLLAQNSQSTGPRNPFAQQWILPPSVDNAPAPNSNNASSSTIVQTTQDSVKSNSVPLSNRKPVATEASDDVSCCCIVPYATYKFLRASVVLVGMSVYETGKMWIPFLAWKTLISSGYWTIGRPKPRAARIIAGLLNVAGTAALFAVVLGATHFALPIALPLWGKQLLLAYTAIFVALPGLSIALMNIVFGLAERSSPKDDVGQSRFLCLW